MTASKPSADRVDVEGTGVERIEVGAIVSLETTAGLGAGGEAVGRAPDGRVVFVRGAAPHERVDVRLVAVGKRHLRGEVERVTRPSPSRVTPPCPLAGTCGGCPLMHLEPRTQAELKRAAGLETLARVGGVRLDPARVALWQGAPLGARSRARLAVRAGRVGFRGARSHEVVDVERCLALHPRLDSARAEVRAALRARPDLAGPSPGRGRRGREERRRKGPPEIGLVTDGSRVAVALPGELASLAPQLRAAGLRVRVAETATAWASGTVSDPGVLELRDRWGRLLLRPDVFSQASLDGNAALLDAVAAHLEPGGRHAIELYAGSGNFTRVLARRFERVSAVEVDPDAVELGRALGLEAATWLEASAAEGYREASRSAPADLVLVDPPRGGLEPELVAALRARAPDRLLYVSCDVGTLARDLERVGGRVSSAAAFDLYPQTRHLEWLIEVRPEP